MVNLVGERGRPLSRGSHADEVDEHCEREDVWTPIQAPMHARGEIGCDCARGCKAPLRSDYSA